MPGLKLLKLILRQRFMDIIICIRKNKAINHDHKRETKVNEKKNPTSCQ
jgi:hypothetical protein